MRPIPITIAGLLLATLSSGCVSMLVPKEDQLNMAGRFEELKVYMEPRIGDMSAAKTWDLWHLCHAYARLREYRKLFPCVDQMEKKIQQGDVGPAMGGTLAPAPPLYRAEAMMEFGNYAKAVEEARRAYDLVPSGGPWRDQWQISALVTLGLAYALNGDRDQAQHFATLLEASPAPSFVVATEKLIGLAKINMALHNFQKSLAFIQQDTGSASRATTDFLLSGGVGDSNFVFQELPKRFIQAKSLYETGQLGEAKAQYDALLSYRQTKDCGDLYWLVLLDRGTIADAEGNRQQALNFYTQAVTVIERQRSTINSEASRIGFVGDKQQVYHRLVLDLIAGGQPAQAFEYVERAKARALVDLLASKQDFAVTTVASKPIAPLVQEVDRTEEDLFMFTASSEESGRRSARGVQVKANLKTAAPELASLVMVTETASSSIQALLEPDETLLEYYYQDDDLYVFAVTRERVQAVKLPGAGLRSDVEQFRRLLEDPKSGGTTALAHQLYGRLVQPIAGHLTVNRLLIIGHGVLHYLPFAALSDGSGYLVDRHSIRLLPSASVLQFLKGHQGKKEGALLAFGNPDLGDARYDLKFAQDEVQTIAKTFPNTKVLVRREATKSAFKTLGPQFTYLHLATHGKFDPDAPLKSGLLLAKDQQDDGFLSLSDLYSLRLNADLVTLSACETGLGKINNGDDVVGLTRGFLYAGSNSIVASLWEVDDLATSLLMTEFYANLKKGDKRDALRQAQLTTKAKYPHPYYWAAFQLTGLP